MACLRSLDIINEIYILFCEECSESWDVLENKPKQRVKLPYCINMDGTVTIALPRVDGDNIFARFCGTGMVELWSACRGMDVFWIDESNCASEEIRSSFMELLKEHGYIPSNSAALADSCYKSAIFDAAKSIDIHAKNLKTTRNKLT